MYIELSVSMKEEERSLAFDSRALLNLLAGS